MFFAGVIAGVNGHPWIAAGLAAAILVQIARLVGESRST
jgi:hypothetical protein